MCCSEAAVREAIKELLIPEISDIKAGVHRLEGRVEEHSSRERR